MVYFIQSLLGMLYSAYLSFRGPRRIKLLRNEKIDLGGLKAYSIRGFELSIYCKEIRYRVYHRRFYVRNYDTSCYELFAVVGDNADQRLKDAIRQPVYLPMIVPPFVGKTVLRKKLVEAYLDILIARLRVNNDSPLSRAPLFVPTE